MQLTRTDHGTSAIGQQIIIGTVAAAAVAATVYLSARAAERKYPPAGQFVDVDGVRAHYLVQGSGQPVVLLHGNGSMAEDWRASGVMGRLSGSNRVIAIDRPGAGYSERPRGRDWSVFAQADFLVGVLDAIGIESAIFVGHSWGTLAALAIAAAYPQRVKGLLLISGYYFSEPRLDAVLLGAPALPVVGDIMRYTISPLASRVLAPRMVKHAFDPRPVPRTFRERFPLPLSLRPWQLRATAEDSAAMDAAAARLEPAYGRLGMPVELIAGTDDRIVATRQSQRLQEVLPNATRTMVSGHGHMVHYDAHTEIERALGRLSKG